MPCHAIDEEAKALYLKHGFIESPIEPLTPMLGLSGLRELSGPAGRGFLLTRHQGQSRPALLPMPSLSQSKKLASLRALFFCSPKPATEPAPRDRQYRTKPTTAVSIRTAQEYEAAVDSLNHMLDNGAASEEHPLADLAATLGSLLAITTMPLPVHGRSRS